MTYDVIEMIQELSTQSNTDTRSVLPSPDPIHCPEDLPLDWRVEWEQRAAIREYDGGLPRKEAERRALVDIILEMGGDHGNQPKTN